MRPAATAVLAAVVVLLACAVSPSAADSPAAARSPFVKVARQARSAVVNIRTVRSVTSAGVDLNPLQEMFRRFFPGGQGRPGERVELPSTGSGFVVDAEGRVLTNHHVIASADEIYVRFTGEQQEYRAEVVGEDPNTDLALLKINVERPLQPLMFGDSDAIEVGDWAIAIGNPFGNLEGSLTVGVISAKGRSDLVIAGGTPRYQDFIQTDASINFGNSGGPLVDIEGQVIGVNTAVNTGGQGIGFAIPSNLARRICSELQRHGRVVRGYLGVRTEPVKPASAAEGGAGTESASGTEGALVVAVLPDSPAAEAGLQEGDVIVSFGGHPVGSPRDLQFLIAEAEVGQETDCVLVRGDRRISCRVQPVELAGARAETPGGEAAGWLGMEVASVTDASPRVRRLKEMLGVSAEMGVIVVAVAPGSPAARAGIRPGDMLVTVNGYEVTDLQLYRELRAQFADTKEPVSLLVRTGAVENYLQVRPEDRGFEQ